MLPKRLFVNEIMMISKEVVTSLKNGVQEFLDA
jgi:hypothetical protein